MIYLIQNDRQYDYDVRAITLAFYEREKIVEIDRSDWKEEMLHPQEGEETVRLYELDFDPDQRRVKGRFTDEYGQVKEEEVICDYFDHEHCRNDVSRFLYRIMEKVTGRSLPWGMLTGIRPTKIIMNWMEEEQDRDRLIQRFSETYLTEDQKARLCTKVAIKEKEILESHNFEEEYSLYIGIAFCPTTCLYCSFASFPIVKFGDRMDGYMDALVKEMEYIASHHKDKKLSTIYIGGGTPTALDAAHLDRLMKEVHRLFPVESTLEFTVEAGRPDSITEEKLQILKAAGVNRISINPQTMHQDTLDIIGRAHTVEQTREAFHLARKVGFDNINMDIITGLPGEDITHVHETLDEIFQLKPESLTVHSLAIKRAANLNIEMSRYRSLVKGSTNEMLKLVDQYCQDMGMEPYYMYRQKNIPGNLENIGYSIPGKECLYNVLIMEEKQDILSCGAGSTSKYVFPEEKRIERTENVKNVDHYINRIDEMIERKMKFLDC